MNNNQLALVDKNNIRELVVKSNGQLVDSLIENHSTIYGNIALSIEQNRAGIDQAVEHIAGYFAANKALEITKEYEETRSFTEKWIKNDPIKQKQMEMKRELSTETTSTAIQLVLKGGVYVVKKVLAHIDNMERKKLLWGLCLRYANDIVDGNIAANKSLAAMMLHIYCQVFNKTSVKSNSIDLSLSGTNEIWVPSNESEVERAALILYMIYSSAHYMCSYSDTKERDFEKLIEFWMYMGIWEDKQNDLLKKFELLDKGKALEYGRLNTVIQSFYNNLSITVPGINGKISREINAELLKYVPNGDKQLAVRRAASIVTKSAITAAAGIVGSSTANPALLTVAASSAVSLIGDLHQTEVIGNCLAEAGVDEKAVKECIENAKRKQLTTI